MTRHFPFEILPPTSRSSYKAIDFKQPTDCREAEYIIKDDNRFYASIVKANPARITVSMTINIASKMYYVTQARSMRSTRTVTCRLKFEFPNAHFVIVTTPNNGNLGGWYVGLPFVARVVVYAAVLGLVVIIIFLIFKNLGTCDGDTREGEQQPQPQSAREITEIDPLIPDKAFRLPYGTGKEDVESGSSSSSEDLYDGNICVICFDMPRNCFFVPCGHCTTCYNCAQRIMEGETHVCPICRRLIHKVRKLIIP